jgi:predicted nucleic acid-binding protein
MSDKFFLDTKVLVYSFDRIDPRKRAIAQDLISAGLESGAGIISYQVVEEFLDVATRKFVIPLTAADAQRYLSVVLEPLCEVYSSPELFHQALEIADAWRLSFHDSLIVAAALQADCRILYSEDLQDGLKIRGLSVRNPFKDR